MRRNRRKTAWGIKLTLEEKVWLCTLPIITLVACSAYTYMDIADEAAMVETTPHVAVMETMPCEVDNEAERIELALTESGYFREDVPLSYDLQDELQTSCLRWGIPYELALAVIQTESNFDPEAVGPDGRDHGLFQIRDSNFQWLTDCTGEDPMETTGNIRCGVWLLHYLVDKYGDTETALTAYRYGHNNGNTSYAKLITKRAKEWSK